MAKIEMLEMDAHRAQLTSDLKRLIDKYVAIFEWDVPEVDEPLSERLIIESLRRGLDDLDRRGGQPNA
ncbi:MAG: hypothetical protein IPG93_23625 [Burkholderiales bacterium]|nr:hypothetical protein [Burkholderiales bacterium]